MRKLLVIGGEGNMSGMQADQTKDNLKGLLAGLSDTSQYEQIVFCFSEQLLEPPEDPEELLPYLREEELVRKLLPDLLQGSEYAKVDALGHESRLQEVRKHPEAFHKKILFIATLNALSLFYETILSFTGGNQVVLIFGSSLDKCGCLFPFFDLSSVGHLSSKRISSINLPITSGIKKWPFSFHRPEVDEISPAQLAPSNEREFTFPWGSKVLASEVLSECRHALSGSYPISYPVEDVLKIPRALLVHGGHEGFLLAIPRPSNMKNFSIALRTGKGIKKKPTNTALATKPSVAIERDWMTRKEVAEAIDKSKDTVDNYCRNGKLKAAKVGREVRITTESVQRFLK